MLKRWDRFAHFINDGRVCLTNNAAERALRGFALGRKSWLFAGSDRGAERAAVMATLIMTAKLNADVSPLINDHAVHRLDELLPWNWRKPMPSRAEAA
jgi:transposase